MAINGDSECTEMPSCSSKEDTISLSMDIVNEDAAVSGKKPSFKGPYVLENCFRKLYFSVGLSNVGKVSGEDEYIIIDEVVDPLTDGWAPLLHPVVLKMHREQPQLIYPLDFQQVVNGGPYEESFFSGNDSDKSCDQSMCGVTQYNGVSMPYSEGFCCSCNSHNQDIPASYYSNPISLTEPELLSRISVKRSISQVEPEVESKRCPPKKPETPPRFCPKKKKNKCKKHPPSFFFENDKILVGRSNERLRCMNKSSSPHSIKHKGQVYAKEEKSRKVRSLKQSGSLRKRVDQERLKRVSDVKQSRTHLTRKSRQACERGNSSVHCLKLSNLWYSVYRFRTPIVVQEISLQVFQKKDDYTGKEYWVDLTRAQTIKLGTFYPSAADELPTISFSYSSQLDSSGEVGKDMSPINIETNVLLMPTQSSSMNENHPETEGGPSEYLVVSKADLSTDGRGCDRIGTLFEGFTRQNRRCERPEGSCLNHQPSDLWAADMERRIRGERGKHFAENFGEVADAVLASAVETVKKDYLAFNFQTPFRSLIEVEIRADTNSLIRPSGNVQILSITADSSGLDRSVIEVLVVNTGLAPGHFRPWLVECNEDLPPDCVPQGPLVFLPPLHRHFFRIHLEGPLPVAEMMCTVEMHNLDGERIASRAVTIKKLDRCLCAYHCSCSCSQENFLCSALMEEEYAAAGFKGRMTTRKILVPAAAPLEAVYLIVAVTMFVLLLLGKLKLLFGCVRRQIRTFGVNFIAEHLHPCFQDCTEKSFRHRVLFLFINWFFFPVYFLIILWTCVRTLATGCCRAKRGSSLSSKSEDFDYTYEMEADDERFVVETMDSLVMLPAKPSRSSHSM